MLSRQVAPLLRKFSKVSAYFTITTQRCHALTMLLSQGNIELSYSCHVAHPDLFPSFQHVNNIIRFSKALVTPAAMAGLTLGVW
jgi:hypothetical protein